MISIKRNKVSIRRAKQNSFYNRAISPLNKNKTVTCELLIAACATTDAAGIQPHTGTLMLFYCLVFIFIYRFLKFAYVYIG